MSQQDSVRLHYFQLRVGDSRAVRLCSTLAESFDEALSRVEARFGTVQEIISQRDLEITRDSRWAGCGEYLKSGHDYLVEDTFQIICPSRGRM